MRWSFLLWLAVCSTLAIAQGSVCEQWFRDTHIDPKSKECFQKCFTSIEGLNETGCERQCDELCRPDLKIWLYFGNGMLNSRDDARDSLVSLNKKLSPFLEAKYPSTLRFLLPQAQTGVSYNTNLGLAFQLIEIVGQKTHGKFTDFFYWLSGLKPAPEWFRKQMAEIGADARFTRVLDSDLKKQVDSYLSHLKEGDAVIVVAHSQGNLYRDEAFRLLDELSGRPQIARFGSVSVATPSGNASPGMIPMGSQWYTTLFSDLLIAHLPTALRANTRNDASGSFDHFWITYLDGNKSGPKILEDTACVLSQLNGALISPSTRTYEEGCHPDEE